MSRYGFQRSRRFGDGACYRVFAADETGNRQVGLTWQQGGRWHFTVGELGALGTRATRAEAAEVLYQIALKDRRWRASK